MANSIYVIKSKEFEDLKKYLRGAKLSHFATANWGSGSVWKFGHGEGRATSRKTYHIGFKIRWDGHHVTCIFLEAPGGNRRLSTQEGKTPTTERDWGIECPTPQEVLKFYKRSWEVADDEEEDDDEDEEEDGDEGRESNNKGDGEAGEEQAKKEKKDYSEANGKANGKGKGKRNGKKK
ncbi:hypothetical protein F53441_9547 [Fusarium austroafricanum]|uniref:Uncharacterized protein n=1 Tax=Fusarium austroafricanum TaxID=2364996 RepID=A0A8H4KC78_9HYPO|nr:hypothetical protein F53441_9547 [Fusarium austroafricanum]